MATSLNHAEFQELVDLDGMQRPQTDDEFNRACDLFARMNEAQTALYYKALEFICCGNVIQYPTDERPTACPTCGSTFELAR